MALDAPEHYRQQQQQQQQQTHPPYPYRSCSNKRYIHMSSLLLLISALLLLVLFSHADPAALDANRDPRQQPGVEFYMVSAIALGDDRAASSCPKFVGLLEPFELNYSLPVKFRPDAADPGASNYVELSENYVLGFSGAPPCTGSPVWTLAPPDSNGDVYLMAGAQPDYIPPPPPPPPAGAASSFSGAALAWQAAVSCILYLIMYHCYC